MTLLTHSPKKPAMPDLEEFMTTREAAEKLGFHVKSIPKMVRDNILEGVRFGRSWLVSRKSVEEYLKKTKALGKRDLRYKGKTK
ncbi:MAG: helix-turn-helix domain-containing protein [Chloroflexota bacterium]